MPSRSQRKRWRSLKRRKGRSEHGLFLAEGPHLVEELLEAPPAIRCVLHTTAAQEDPEIGAALAACRERGVSVEEVSPGEFGTFADTVRPRGILAVAEIPDWRREHLGTGGDRIAPAATRTAPENEQEPILRGILLLDAVQDPGNVGTLIRTAEALGVHGAVALEGTADVWNPKTVRASAGSVLRLPVVKLSWEGAAPWLAERGFEVWAATAGGDPVGRREPPPARLALVLGNEGSGVSDAGLGLAARRVAVPLRRPVESLNVAVAAAILMDRIFGRRDRAGVPGAADCGVPGGAE